MNKSTICKEERLIKSGMKEIKASEKKHHGKMLGRSIKRLGVGQVTHEQKALGN